MVVGGQEKERFSYVEWSRSVRSPDLRRVAYHHTNNNVGPDTPIQPGYVIVDGQRGKSYEEGERLLFLMFSPDSQRVAYAIHGASKWVVVVDGQEGEWYDIIESLVFSPDSQRVAYVIRLSKTWFVVVDGREQWHFDRIERSSLVFSPDSQRLAYIARRAGEWFVVVDGQEPTSHEDVNEGSLVFSPDSQRVAWVVNSDQGGDGQLSHSLSFVVVDGQVGKFSQLAMYRGMSPHFSRGIVRLAYVASQRRNQFVVVDEQEGNHYESIEGSIIFDSPDQLHYIARMGKAFYLVKERLA